MKEKKKIPWGLIYVGLTVVVMIVFGLVNTEFAGMFSVIANLSLGFVALAVLMTGVFLVTEGGIIHMLLRAQGEHRLLDNGEDWAHRHLLFLHHAELHGRAACAGRLPAAR